MSIKKLYKSAEKYEKARETLLAEMKECFPSNTPVSIALPSKTLYGIVTSYFIAIKPELYIRIGNKSKADRFDLLLVTKI